MLQFVHNLRRSSPSDRPDRLTLAESNGLISLLDVLKAYAKPFAEMNGWLSDLHAELAANPTADISEGAPSFTADMVRAALESAERHAKELELDDVRRQISRLRIAWAMDDGIEGFGPRRLMERIRVIQETICSDLGSPKAILRQAARTL
jgi:hypothetical protein